MARTGGWQCAGLVAGWLLMGACLAQPVALATARATDTVDTKPITEKAKIYQYRVDGTVTFSDQPPLRGAYVIWRPSCFACKITSSINWRAIRLHLSEFAEFINGAAKAHDVDPALVRALIHAESNFNPRARSHKGAAGLMQLMPGTARMLKVGDVFVPANNIKGGVAYLAGLLKRFHGNTDLAVAAYNAGPEAVSKYQGIPPYAETQVYVERVRILHGRYREQPSPE